MNNPQTTNRPAVTTPAPALKIVSRDDRRATEPPGPAASRLARAASRAVASFHLAWLRRPLPRHVAIYMHGLEPRKYAAFAEMATFFGDRGYIFVGPTAHRTRRRDQRTVFLSFDDNFFSWYEALAVLQDYGVRATFFTNTGPVRDTSTAAETAAYYARINYNGDCRSLSRTEIRALHTAGHTIGCHGHSHLDLRRLDRARWDSEIADSKTRLEDIIGAPVRHFSFPFGMPRHFSPALARYCLDLGFESIASGVPGLQYAPPRAPYIHRSRWDLAQPLAHNLNRLCVDGRWFVRATGRSPIG